MWPRGPRFRYLDKMRVKNYRAHQASELHWFSINKREAARRLCWRFHWTGQNQDWMWTAWFPNCWQTVWTRDCRRAYYHSSTMYWPVLFANAFLSIHEPSLLNEIIHERNFSNFLCLFLQVRSPTLVLTATVSSRRVALGMFTYARITLPYTPHIKPMQPRTPTLILLQEPNKSS